MKERHFERLADRPILLVHAPARARQLVESLVARRPLFVCTVAHTDTADIEGLSAAGATAGLRRLTAAADAEALIHGRPRCMEGLPSNPLGAPGPVLITLASLRLASIPVQVINAGLRVEPDAPMHVVGDRWGASILTGRAVPNAGELLGAGRALGAQLAKQADYLILGESVPAGTTTALALLCGMGLNAWDKVSSSMAGNAHELKNLVVRRALRAAGLDGDARARSTQQAYGTREARGRHKPDALSVAAAVGDPMQPVVAGLTLGAVRSVPVLLAGGSQMAAVLALAAAVAEQQGHPLDPEHLAIATTGWVARDPTSDLKGLAEQLGEVPVVASDLYFGASRHPPLRRYEEFLVKEGVGAGAAAVAASLVADVSAEQLTAEIECVYEEIYGVRVGQAAH